MQINILTRRHQISGKARLGCREASHPKRINAFTMRLFGEWGLRWQPT
ncbi:hypothetical protein [Prochlorococcus sp. MIT 1307]|nr:hypothetical protein [Prochlorococcus sp. MIT 1307]